MEPFIGEIIMFGGNFAPRGWALCDGQLPDHREIEQWKSELGSRFRIEDESYVLRSVGVTDCSADHARPRDLRPHSIELLFVRSSRRTNNDPSSLQLCHRSQQITLNRVVAPQGESGDFYEGIIN